MRRKIKEVGDMKQGQMRRQNYVCNLNTDRLVLWE
jgi:hypothetical protein